MTPVVCAPSGGRRHTKTISVKLTSDQVDLLSTDTSDPSKMQYGVYLYMAPYHKVCMELRDKPGRPVQVEIPMSFMARINGTGVLLNNAMSYNPMELTSSFRVTTEYANRVDLVYTTSVAWVAAIVIAARHTPLSLAGQIRGRELASADEVRQQFFKGAAENGDDDVISEGALVNLKCPLGLCRIQIPSRSKNCKHSQCFDCETFLQFYQGKQQWRCPVCSIIIQSWKELIIDGYFDEILKKTSESDEQIYIEPDGVWKTKNNMSTPKSSVKRTSGRPLEVSEVDAIDVSDLSSSEQNAGPNKRRRTEFVDLTLDSDSEGSENSFDLPPMTQEEIEIVNAAEAAEASISSNDNTQTSQVTPATTTSTTTSAPAAPEPTDVAPTPSSVPSTVSDRAAAAPSSATPFRPILPAAADPAVPASNPSTPALSRVSSAQYVANSSTLSRQTMASYAWATAPRRRIDTTTRPISAPTSTTPIRSGHGTTTTPSVSGHENSRRIAYTATHRRVRTGIGRRSTGNNIAPPHLARGISETHNQAQRSAVISNTVRAPISAPVSPTGLTSHAQALPSASTTMTVAPMQVPNLPAPNRTPQRSPHRSPVIGMSPTYTTLFLNAQLGGPRPPVNNASATSQSDSRTTTM
ncbi:E3 SUMO-protein ligase pli1 [Coemansia guatemalensis]|uniref:E3 SUMO-protein ligase pli1 n=1 Tax=Coemansia guatemalensis TaxID=2761395 RepID=A0A9W8LVF2_9FUNG|nr:E3 SUMO-protein ligase pli1 [Coemansia guatemalensis]